MSQIQPVNFRDIGGIPVANGTLTPNIFFRSGQVVDISNDTVDFLQNSCSLKRIYDFRSAEEVQKMPDTKIPSVTFTHLDILQTAKANQASMDEMVEGTGDAHENMLTTYEQMVTSDSARHGYAQFLTDLLTNNDPLLFHCFAGKDRTGFAAALILKIAGANDHQIMEDYLKTNTLRKEANQQIIAYFKDTMSTENLEQLQIALNVAPEYLNRANDTITNTFGSFNNYLHEGLGLENGFVSEFRHQYVK